MCGIPMLQPEPPEAVRGKRLTFEQAVAHVGGVENLVSQDGRALIRQHAKQYLWKYPDKRTWCTACGRSIEGFYGSHGRRYACPRCGADAEFRYEAKGHRRVYDEFYLYEWRQSVIDPETIVLTGAYCSRNSTGAEPHRAEVEADPTAVYVFRPGAAVTVYKKHRFWGREGIEWQWARVDSVHPAHTQWSMQPLDIAMDYAQFQAVMRNTRIGRLYGMLRPETNEWHPLELTAIANCARRPWLEYVYKSGQRYLAGQLMREETIPKYTGINRHGKTPRALLNLTEGQWYEVRREDICLTLDALRTLRAMEALDIGPVKVSDALRISGGTLAEWHIRRALLPSKNFTSVCTRLALLPDKPRRKILRRILNDLRHADDWRDYYGQLARLRQVPTEGDAFTEADMALLLPKDMMAMHQRMTEREHAIAREKQRQAAAIRDAALAALLEKRLRDAYTFRAAGLILRPYESTGEVVDEGAALHICIGSYAERYANGDTVICCLRRADEPDEPWRAVEFSAKTGKVVQDRGAYNDARGGIPPGTKAQLRNFWNAWDKAHRKGRKSA